MFVDLDLSINDIADKLNVNRLTVMLWLKRYDIRTRKIKL